MRPRAQPGCSLYSQEKIDGWVNTYGQAFMVRGPFWVHHRLWTIDPRAITHIMGSPNDYRKSEMLRRAARRYLRSGLIDAEGERHKVQRKVVQRLFSRNSLKLFGKVTQEKTDQVSRTSRTRLISSSPVSCRTCVPIPR
jgi:cytochrome P450